MKSAKTILVIISTLFLVISSSCGPFWELAKDPDIQGPSWDVSVELPVVGKTDETRIIILEYIAEYLGYPVNITYLEVPAKTVEEVLKEVGPIEVELPTEAGDLAGTWIRHAKLLAEIEYLLVFGANVSIYLSDDRGELFSDPVYERTVRLPLSEGSDPSSALIELDFDLTLEEIQNLLKGTMFVGVSVELLLPEGSTTVEIYNKEEIIHYVWPKIWAVADVRINPPDEQR